MTWKVIQWATGGVGRAAIEGVLDHPELELVGCWVHGEAKEGQDVGTLVGRAPIGVCATRDVDGLLALKADCVIYSPLMADPKILVRILRAGIDVVTPLGWIYPKRIDAREIETACREGGSTLHGTGIHPGGITERFPLMVSAPFFGADSLSTKSSELHVTTDRSFGVTTTFTPASSSHFAPFAAYRSMTHCGGSGSPLKLTFSPLLFIHLHSHVGPCFVTKMSFV